jgi:hypothetical protein
VKLEGRHGRVERLSLWHAASLWPQVKHAEPIWTYIPDSGPFPDEAAFHDWLARPVAAEDPYAYAIVDRDGRAVGTAALMNINPTMRVIEVGSIVYGPALQRTPLGTETHICWHVTPSRRSAIAAMNGHAMRSTRRQEARRCVTASRSKASSVST